MPWRELKIMDEREEFVLRSLSEDTSFVSLCKEYGISRKTGYKWRDRFLEDGKYGLGDKSRRPKSSPSELTEDVVIKILQIRHHHPSWGAKKIACILKEASVSSVYRVLAKANLLKKKRSHKVKALHKGNLNQLIEPNKPNDVWTIDYKGWWLSEDIKRCNPLTVRDLKTRYSLDVILTPRQDTPSVKVALKQVFTEYGLPKVIRSDNGAPFASYSSPLGLSRLSVIWMSLGILPDRITPGKPYQNGAHERMHRDLKEEVQSRTRGSVNYYQRLLDEWRYDYNFTRPHEALDMLTPATLYRPSPRKFEGYPDEIEYPQGLETRRVCKNGFIKWGNQPIRISSAFQGYQVGLACLDRDTLEVWFSNFRIGMIDLVSLSFYTIAKERGYTV